MRWRRSSENNHSIHSHFSDENSASSGFILFSQSIGPEFVLGANRKAAQWEMSNAKHTSAAKARVCKRDRRSTAKRSEETMVSCFEMFWLKKKQRRWCEETTLSLHEGCGKD